MLVDKKYVHEVRRQVEAMALQILCAKMTGKPDMSVAGDTRAINDSVQHALDLRKKVDEMVQEKKPNVDSPTNDGDITKTLDSTN